jgi:exopolyphosphatase/guanosine-5'-triphosphate,3'-diphosphate pyrophosphatase
MCLRLAVIRHHARGGAEGPRMGLQREGPQALLKWGRSRTPPSPRTLYLLREEVQAWSRFTVPALVLTD